MQNDEGRVVDEELVADVLNAGSGDRFAASGALTPWAERKRDATRVAELIDMCRILRPRIPERWQTSLAGVLVRANEVAALRSEVGELRDENARLRSMLEGLMARVQALEACFEFGILLFEQLET